MTTGFESFFRSPPAKLIRLAIFAIALQTCFAAMALTAENPSTKIDFVKDVQPIFKKRCISCHGESKATQGLRLDLKSEAFEGGDSGPALIPARADQSLILERVDSSGSDRMPPEGEPLSTAERLTLRHWIEQGAVWPEGVDSAQVVDRFDWWSLKPIGIPPIPLDGSSIISSTSREPIDEFIGAKLTSVGLAPSPDADIRILSRRAYFDLIGLPPSPQEIDEVVADGRPDAYERLIDRLLASPHSGERWARHWLDVVHYGDTHGYDKDKLRTNAWPYRDYVIRSLNADKPYARFVEEQIAGDVLYPSTEDGITATGFIAAGPWDFIGHAEVPESKTDGKIARNLDRDDMVANTFNTFQSLTVQCARCHNHKFDPVTQEDYYRLQAVFSALDRSDRTYEIEPSIGQRRFELMARHRELEAGQKSLESQLAEAGGERLQQFNQSIADAKKLAANSQAAQFGYHSQIEPNPNVTKWVQVDLGSPVEIRTIQLVGCDDDFNQIGAGFGFPVRFRIEVSQDSQFLSDVIVIHDATQTDVSNPGIKPLQFNAGLQAARYVRITATRLALRQDDYIFALAELSVVDSNGNNVARGKMVTARDSIEAPPRWSVSNLVDGYFKGMVPSQQIAELESARALWIEQFVPLQIRTQQRTNEQALKSIAAAIAELPSPRRVYAGMIYSGQGTFVGTGNNGGQPRPIHILSRGDVNQPGKPVGPGTVRLSRDAIGEFDLPANSSDSDRRKALAHWMIAPENPLTWRSIVNRVWTYHFGRGIVDSPNDFGRMGQAPSHPELLDWLAVEFRDGGQSMKRLHRMIVTSSTYRQSSSHASTAAVSLDAGNTYLARMNRRKLDAESIRDAVLLVSGQLNSEMQGPAFQDFVIEKPEHSPHFEYRLHDPKDPKSYRRSIYRFLVRSQPQPFMATLDCADPSMSVDKRSETITALQALALLNNRIMLTLSQRMAERLTDECPLLSDQIERGFQLAISRHPTHDEQTQLVEYATQHGLTAACRVLLNLNEFVFID